MSRITPDVIMEPNPPFSEFLSTIPSPLVAVLVGLAPFISAARHVIEIVSWKSQWEESWLTLALWWAVCLLGDVALRYALPLTILLSLIVARRFSKAQPIHPPVTEDNLQRTIADLTAIHALLPRTPPTPTIALPVLLRVSAILYIPYLSLTYFFGLRVLIGITGTIALTWKARWAALIRRGFWRSAWIRWSVYLAWSRLSGQPMPPRQVSPLTITLANIAKKSSDKPKSSINTIRFLFTVNENQRWWMGLDWTAALLPGERPSWCSASQQPVAPPSTFALPAPTTAYTMEGKTRMKRVARWRWEEEEWRVMVHSEGTTGMTRVERPLPKDEPSAASSGANRILKAAGRMRQASVHGLSEGSPERHRGEDLDGGRTERTGNVTKGVEVDEEVWTDADGWVYGDNKWEGASGKGGMGKYTRYRRWTRIAVLYETIEPVEPGELGIRRDVPADNIVKSSEQSPVQPVVQSPVTQAEPQLSDEKANGSVISVSSPCEEERNRLRQRLQAAVKRTTEVLNGHARTDSSTSETY